METDILGKILAHSIEKNTENVFLQSLQEQYYLRGGLSKAQLEGLLKNLHQIPNFPTNYIATVEAIIKKKSQKFKSAKPQKALLFEIDNEALQNVLAILAKYPQHKKVLFYKTKLEKGHKLLPMEQEELQKFKKILLS